MDKMDSLNEDCIVAVMRSIPAGDELPFSIYQDLYCSSDENSCDDLFPSAEIEVEVSYEGEKRPKSCMVKWDRSKKNRFSRVTFSSPLTIKNEFPSSLEGDSQETLTWVEVESTSEGTPMNADFNINMKTHDGLENMYEKIQDNYTTFPKTCDQDVKNVLNKIIKNICGLEESNESVANDLASIPEKNDQLDKPDSNEIFNINMKTHDGLENVYEQMQDNCTKFTNSCNQDVKIVLNKIIEGICGLEESNESVANDFAAIPQQNDMLDKCESDELKQVITNLVEDLFRLAGKDGYKHGNNTWCDEEKNVEILETEGQETYNFPKADKQRASEVNQEEHPGHFSQHKETIPNDICESDHEVQTLKDAALEDQQNNVCNDSPINGALDYNHFIGNYIPCESTVLFESPTKNINVDDIVAVIQYIINSIVHSEAASKDQSNINVKNLCEADAMKDLLLTTVVKEDTTGDKINVGNNRTKQLLNQINEIDSLNIKISIESEMNCGDEKQNLEQNTCIDSQCLAQTSPGDSCTSTSNSEARSQNAGNEQLPSIGVAIGCGPEKSVLKEETTLMIRVGNCFQSFDESVKEEDNTSHVHMLQACCPEKLQNEILASENVESSKQHQDIESVMEKSNACIANSTNCLYIVEDNNSSWTETDNNHNLIHALTHPASQTGKCSAERMVSMQGKMEKMTCHNEMVSPEVKGMDQVTKELQTISTPDLGCGTFISDIEEMQLQHISNVKEDMKLTPHICICDHSTTDKSEGPPLSHVDMVEDYSCIPPGGALSAFEAVYTPTMTPERDDFLPQQSEEQQPIDSTFNDISMQQIRNGNTCSYEDVSQGCDEQQTGNGNSYEDVPQGCDELSGFPSTQGFVPVSANSLCQVPDMHLQDDNFDDMCLCTQPFHPMKDLEDFCVGPSLMPKKRKLYDPEDNLPPKLQKCSESSHVGLGSVDIAGLRNLQDHTVPGGEEDWVIDDLEMQQRSLHSGHSHNSGLTVPRYPIFHWKSSSVEMDDHMDPYQTKSTASTVPENAESVKPLIVCHKSLRLGLSRRQRGVQQLHKNVNSLHQV